MVGEGLFDDEVTEDGEALGRKKVARFQGHLLDLGGLFYNCINLQWGTVD